MEITLELIVFTVLAVFTAVSAVLAVTTKRILRAATYLLFVLFGTAGIYFQLNYSFLGAVQLLIYAGGITVLYRGVQTDVGTGFTDREREEIAAAGQAPCAIAEVEFMELTSDGKLREPRFKGWRYDKDMAD